MPRMRVADGGDVAGIRRGGEPVADLRVRYAPLQGIEIPLAQVPLAIDEFPALFIAAACAQGRTVLRGAEELLANLSRKLQVAPGGTTEDGKITLEFAECIGVCEGAPCVLINDEHRANVTEDKVDELIQELTSR